MTVIVVKWSVADIDTVMDYYDQCKVYRSTTGETGDYSEITGVGTRVDLITDIVSYEYDDTTGDDSYYYKVSYFNSSTLAESEKSSASAHERVGYISIQDIRDEGYTATMVTDAQVTSGIARATAMIDKITGQWFEPRPRTFLLDGRGHDALHFQVPIIAITGLEIEESTEEIDFDTIKVYNRHLTQGLVNPDDRYDPKLVFDNVTWLRTLTGRDTTTYVDGLFYHGPQNISVTGIFGFTELGLNDPIGETSTGSQVPLSYGDTPELIKYAAKRLAIRYMYPIINSGTGSSISSGTVKRRKNMDEEIEWAVNNVNPGDSVTGDYEVDNILAGYMAPMSIGAI